MAGGAGVQWMRETTELHKQPLGFGSHCSGELGRILSIRMLRSDFHLERIIGCSVEKQDRNTKAFS